MTAATRKKAWAGKPAHDRNAVDGARLNARESTQVTVMLTAADESPFTTTCAVLAPVSAGRAEEPQKIMGGFPRP
jgi:hypothetical protein